MNILFWVGQLDFLVTGDALDQAVYDVSGLANANHNMDKLYIAIEIAKRI